MLTNINEIYQRSSFAFMHSFISEPKWSMCTQIHRQKSNLLIDLKTKRIRNSGACVHSFTANYKERTTYSTQIRSRKISVDLFFSSHFQCHRHVVRAAVVVLFYFSIPLLLEMCVCAIFICKTFHTTKPKWISKYSKVLLWQSSIFHMISIAKWQSPAYTRNQTYNIKAQIYTWLKTRTEC